MPKASHLPRESSPAPSDLDALQEGRRVLVAAAQCLAALAEQLDSTFAAAVERILGCKGALILCGIGKAGHVARKISATFASTGTLSIYLHPTEAVHGDLGRVSSRDVVLALSNSGTSAELIRLVQPLKSIGATLIVVTGVASSPLAKEADVVLCYGETADAGPLGLAPTTTTTAMLALGDALAMAVLKRRNFSPAEFARFHPAGALGRSLMKVEDVMRRGDANPVIAEDRPLADVLHLMSSARGRPGAASIVDARGILVGFFTDGDFRRHMEEALERDPSRFLREPIARYMTRGPAVIAPDRLVGEAMRMLRERNFDQLPVVDAAGRPVGLIDVQDVLDWKVLG